MSTSQGSSTFCYDALGRRRARSVSGTTTAYLHDGDDPATVGGDLMLSGLGVDEFLARIDASTGATSHLTDALGSTVALTDASGAVQTQYTYEPYGNSTATGAANENSFKFTGREQDVGSLHYYRARYYDASLGRFISEDPIGFGRGPNLYAYVGGDPVSRTDSSGQIIDTIVDAGFILYDVYRLIEDNAIHDCDNFGTNLAALGADSLAAIIPGVTGGGIGVRAAKAAEWTLGSGKSATKWANQMAKRGWKEKQIGEALSTKGIPTRNAVNPGNPATRHVHPETGQSVVIDSKTNEIIHIGGKDFDYSNWDLLP